MKLRGGSREIFRIDDHVAAADVEIVLQDQCHRLRAEGLLERAVEGPDLFHRGAEAARQDGHLLPDLHDAAGDLSAEAAEVVENVIGGVIRAVHPLDRHPEIGEVPVAGDVDGLQMSKQRGAGIPGGVRRVADDVVAVEGAHRDELHVLDVETREELIELFLDLKESFLAPVDQIHLVDGNNEVRDAEQGGDDGMATALLDDSLARIDQDDREVGRRGTGHHVPGVLNVARGVGDDELPVRGRKVAVGHVDGDPLLPLRSEPVGKVGEIDLSSAGDVGGALKRLDLILHEGLGVVEEAADQGRLAVIDGPAGIEAE